MDAHIYKLSDKVPEPTLRRLPWYLSNAKLMRDRGEKYVSSTQISKQINIDSSQVAKDLSYVKIAGRTRVGYEIDTLINVLEDFLGFTNMHKAYLFGVGSLGGALLGDTGLKHFGLEIVGAFDINPALVGKEINGIPIYHSDEFEALMTKINETFDLEERAALFSDAAQIIADDCPAIFYAATANYDVINTAVMNDIDIYPIDYYVIDNTWTMK
jgi:redox-sensing transcriptional repressor